MNADQFAVSLGFLREAADVAFENATPQPGQEYMLEAAKARFAEGLAMLTLSNGRSYPFDQKLLPLIHAIDDFVISVDKHVNRVIDENVPESQLETEILSREAAMAALDQARLAGCSMLVHLSKAMAGKPALAVV